MDDSNLALDTCFYCEFFTDMRCGGDNRCYDNIKREYTSFKRTV